MDKLIYDNNCSTCCFIKSGLQKITNKKLQFIAANIFRPTAAKYDIRPNDLRATLHYIQQDGKIYINAEACVHVISNIKYLNFVKYLYFRPISYLFDSAYYILKKIRKLIK